MSPESIDNPNRERLLRVLVGITFLIFFQAYMVAPMIPRLSTVFGVSAQRIGLAVPAYLIPYGISTLFFGVLSDRVGRRRIVLVSLSAFAVLTGLTATAASANQIILWRLLTGLGASGVVPLALALIGSLFPYEQRGRPLGWLFGAMAGGMAFGSTFGVLLEPAIGWRGVFLAVSAVGFIALVLLRPYAALLSERPLTRTMTIGAVVAGYKYLLTLARGQRTYVYVLLNAIFHSGVFTWFGLYFSRRYGLGEIGIGRALLGYGVPGFLLGPVIGRAADRWSRRWLLPAGIGLAAVCPDWKFSRVCEATPSARTDDPHPECQRPCCLVGVCPGGLSEYHKEIPRDLLGCRRFRDWVLRARQKVPAACCV
jgi:predicted MFS family arabinose efflux permease